MQQKEKCLKNYHIVIKNYIFVHNNNNNNNGPHITHNQYNIYRPSISKSVPTLFFSIDVSTLRSRDIIVVQQGLERFESWSVIRFGLPATEHDVVQRIGTPLGRWHAIPSVHGLQHLPVVHARVGHGALRDDLRNGHAVGPDVGLDAETVVECGLRGRPLDGEFRALPGVVNVLLDDARQSKVRHLADISLAHEDVACSQITVDVGMLLQIAHT